MEWMGNNVVFFFGVIFTILVTFIVYVAGNNTNPELAILLLSTSLTAVGSIATYMQAVEARRQRESAERPEIGAYFKAADGWMILKVQNFGALPAKNIQISFSRSIKISADQALEDIPFVKRGISYLPPGESCLVEINPMYTDDSGQILPPSYEDADGQILAPFEINLEYQSSAGKTYKDTIMADLSILISGPEVAIPSHLNTMSQKLTQIAKALEAKK